MVLDRLSGVSFLGLGRVAGYLSVLDVDRYHVRTGFCFLPLFLICGFFVFWHMGVCSESVSCSYACFLKWFLMCRFLDLFLALVSCCYALLSGFTERFVVWARSDGISGRNTETTGVLK